MGTENQIAVVAAACRLPGAPDVAAYWDLLANGRDAITREPRPEGVPSFPLSKVGEGPALAARGRLDGVELFDAPFFGFSAADARLADPQLRLLLEVGYHALEAADRTGGPGRTGVFASAGISSYLLNNLVPNAARLPDWHDVYTVNDKDFVASRLAYAFDLTGPAVSVQTACSSSLVAVHLAVQSLLTGECDTALVAGAGVYVPQDATDIHRAGGIVSSDGYCRAFDADATGTVFGNGVVAVVLRRLDDAIADGDEVLAAILGTAVNNDGRRKPGYLSPSIDGQRECITAALSFAGVSPDDVGMVEAHGTGTPLGDPVEIAALWDAWVANGSTGRACAVGSVKTNIGHVGEAAGLAGLLKAVLAVHHGVIPPSLHFTTGNPAFDWDTAPFYVPTEARDWPDGRRVAGVTSLGMGGTNAHVLVGSYDAAPAARVEDPDATVLLSAASRASLATLAAGARDLVERDPTALAATAATLSRRPARRYRAAASGDAATVAEQLAAIERAAVSAPPIDGAAAAVFAFGGQGNVDAGAARALFERSAFARHAGEALALLDSELAATLRAVLTEEAAAGAVTRTAVAQPLIFLVQSYAADELRSAGIVPCAVTGHSVGEVAAAYAAGALSFADGLRLAAGRGAAMERLAGPGALAAVQAPADAVRGQLPDGVVVAADNSSRACAVSGSPDAVAAALAALRRNGVRARRLDADRAFHSPDMTAAAAAVAEVARAVTFREPAMPFVSTATGERLDGTTLADPGYWSAQVLLPVSFRAAVRTIDATFEMPQVWFDIGLAPVLSVFLDHDAPARLRGSICPLTLATTSVVAGAAWALGVDVPAPERGRPSARVVLPYPFDRTRHWVDAPVGRPDAAPAAPADAPVPMPDRLGADDLLRVVRSTWCDVLGVPDVAADADYFELGGQSLAAITLVEELSRLLPGVAIPPMRSLLSDPTPAGMAGTILTYGDNT